MSNEGSVWEEYGKNMGRIWEEYGKSKIQEESGISCLAVKMILFFTFFIYFVYFG